MSEKEMQSKMIRAICHNCRISRKLTKEPHGRYNCSVCGGFVLEMNKHDEVRPLITFTEVTAICPKCGVLRRLTDAWGNHYCCSACGQLVELSSNRHEPELPVGVSEDGKLKPEFEPNINETKKTEKPYYLIHRPGCINGSITTEITSLEEAKEEAAKLAKEKPGYRFYIMQSISYYVAEPQEPLMEIVDI